MQVSEVDEQDGLAIFFKHLQPFLKSLFKKNYRFLLY